MKELSDGRWQIDSAFEADRIGRVAAYESKDGSSFLFFSHYRNRPLTINDEVEFLNRTLSRGPLVISKTAAKQAEKGLIASAIPKINTKEDPSLIPSDEAAIFLAVLAMSRDVSIPEVNINEAA